MRESTYAARVVKKLNGLFPGCVILKNDAELQQGIPDRLLLWGRNWAMLEFKVDRSATKQPNQEYWIEYLGRMSFAAFIYPDNEEEVLHALQQAFQPCGDACLFERQ